MLNLAGTAGMAFEELPLRQKELIRDCMNAIAQGPFFDDCEFSTRLGITRAQLYAVLVQWPGIGDAPEEQLAVNNCLNEILHGVYVSPQQWQEWFSGTKAELADAYNHWASLCGLTRTGLM